MTDRTAGGCAREGGCDRPRDKAGSDGLRARAGRCRTGDGVENREEQNAVSGRRREGLLQEVRARAPCSQMYVPGLGPVTLTLTSDCADEWVGVVCGEGRLALWLRGARW